MASAAKRYAEHNYESAALEIFAAIDATGAKRFPGKGNGARFKGLVEQQEDLITYVAVGNCILGLNIDGVSIAQAIWKHGRNPLDHQAELGDRISFDRASGMAIGSKWRLPNKFLLGLMIGVITAKENAGESELVPGDVAPDFYPA